MSIESGDLVYLVRDPSARGTVIHIYTECGLLCVRFEDGFTELCTPEEVECLTTKCPPMTAEVCRCIRCVRERDEKINGIPYELGRMVVCPKCGYKRCPHATDHAEECTRSNSPGQPGSIFE